MQMLTAAETARRLGVKRETLYAYVSRGVLVSGRDGRASRFAAEEVEQLARRGRPRRATRRLTFEVELDTHLTQIEGHALRFRGHDAVELATTATYEQVAELLWTGELPGWRGPWAGAPVSVPDAGRLFDRIVLAVAMAGAADPARGDLRPEAVAATGATLIASVVDALPRAGPGRRVPRLALGSSGSFGSAGLRSGTIAGRLWTKLAPSAPRSSLLAVLNAALVLTADHELAASTFAARVAASVRADPYAVIGAGLGPMAGPLHGRASRLARELLDAASGPGGAPAALAETLRLHGRYPGFGHPLYPEGDPRARALLDLLRRSARGTRAMAVVDDVLAAAQHRAPLQPNVDFAIAALGSVAAMPRDAGEVIFTVARMAGWLAHAIEEYGEQPGRFRPRANFVPG